MLDRKPRFIVLVLTQLGNPDGPPTGPAFSTWTPRRKTSSIIRSSSAGTQAASGQRRRRAVAGSPGQGIGATRMFQHAYPGAYYLLTVCERQDTPIT